MADPRLALRLRHLPVATVLGREVRVARGAGSRLLGLAHLDRFYAGAGLFIPRCSSVHTFGMRFALDLYFLDEGERILDVRRAVPARRVVSRRGAHAVLEIPAREGGEFLSPSP
ncbi:MAG TPA: DUF192 domain-containing protein [Solirubrobacterales bacterium]|nr:DUF192 domain-containing protein [Solirubrobacterales bacterium]